MYTLHDAYLSGICQLFRIIFINHRLWIGWPYHFEWFLVPKRHPSILHLLAKRLLEATFSARILALKILRALHKIKSKLFLQPSEITRIRSQFQLYYMYTITTKMRSHYTHADIQTNTTKMKTMARKRLHQLKVYVCVLCCVWFCTNLFQALLGHTCE